MLTNYTYQKKLFALVIFSFNTILIAFSPYLSLALLFLSLTLAQVFFGKKSYIYFLPLLIILLAYLASSRGIFETPKDDLSDYYKNFIAINNGNLMALFEWGQGVEIGLPIVSLIISLILPEAPPRLFLFCHLVIIFGLFFWYLNKFFIAKSTNPAIYIFVICLFLGFTGIGNLLRQSYSSIFILASFGYVGRKKIFLIMLATLFHFSSPIIYLLISWLIRPNKKKLFFTLISSIIFYALVWQILLPTIDQFSFLKLTAYVTRENEGLELSTIIRAYKEVALLGIVGLAYYFLNYWKSLAAVYFSIIFLTITILLELVLPGISLRINHAIISFCIGPIVFYILTAEKSLSLFSVSIFIPCLFLLKTLSFITNPNDMALFNDKILIYSKPFAYIDFLDEDIPNNKRVWKKLKYE